MESKRDYYEVLGVSKTADEAQLKKHIENWRKSIIRIQMPEMLMQSRCLKDHRGVLCVKRSPET